MKKKIALTLVVILVIGVMVGALTGCDEIFKKNNERDLNQVVASVNYADQTTNVLKFEMIDTFNAYAYVYVNYYGMSYQQAADYVVKSLAERELLVLFAKNEIASVNSKKAGETILPVAMTYYNPDQEYYSFLGKAEYNKAIEDTNKDLLNALEEAVKQAIQEDKANAGDDTQAEDDVYTGDINNPVYINFDSNGGSKVDKKVVESGKKTYEPAAPTKAGFTFYGWSETLIKSDEPIDWNKIIDWKEHTFTAPEGKDTIKLYAVWKENVTPRTERPEVKEEEEDFDPTVEPETISPKFFTDEYRKTIDFNDKDFVKDIILDGEKLEDKLNEYIDDAISTLKKNIEKQHKNYEYFLEQQYKTLVLAKLERMVHKDVEKEYSPTAAEVEARFNQLVASNKETFGTDGKKFENAFKTNFATSAMHVYKTVDGKNHGYGLVHNILIKLPQKDVETLYDIRKDHGQAQALLARDKMLKEMTVKVSNPDYDADAQTFPVDADKKPDKSQDPILLKDPMTDTKNPYIAEGTYYNKNNDYNKIVTFEYVESTDQRVIDKELEEGFQVVFNVHEAPAMAYLINNWPAFTTGDQTGIIEQIYDSLEQVKSYIGTGEKKLTKEQAIYWMREVSTAWLYLVGDDGGSLNTESNNGGLGYLVNPEGEESGFLKGFTEQARALIDKGVGAHFTTDSTDRQEQINTSYKFDDNFIVGKGETMPEKSSAYAGAFVLMATQVSYVPTYDADRDTEGFHSAQVGEDFIVQYDKDADKCLTMKAKLEKDMLESKKKAAYQEKTNKFGVKASKENIKYYNDAYESVYKDLEKANK